MKIIGVKRDEWRMTVMDDFPRQHSPIPHCISDVKLRRLSSDPLRHISHALWRVFVLCLQNGSSMAIPLINIILTTTVRLIRYKGHWPDSLAACTIFTHPPERQLVVCRYLIRTLAISPARPNLGYILH